MATTGRQVATVRRSAREVVDVPPAEMLDADVVRAMVARAGTRVACAACGGTGSRRPLAACRECDGSGDANLAARNLLRRHAMAALQTLAAATAREPALVVVADVDGAA